MEYARYIYSGFRDFCHRKTGWTLEIGPGTSLGVSMLFARDGSNAVAVDIVDARLPNLRDTYRQLLEGVDARVHYVQSCIEELPFVTGAFDFVFSNSCLEHIRDPIAAVAEIRRVLRRGGRTAHQIDFRDHRHFDDPLRFLRYGDRMWSWMNAEGPGHQNRWRLSQFVREFRAAGFEVDLEINMVAKPEQLHTGRRARLYQNLSEEDLTTLSARLLASG
jgi:SAM-dependent methyltransferase